MKVDFEVVEDIEVLGRTSKCCQAQGSSDEREVVHVKMVVKYEVGEEAIDDEALGIHGNNEVMKKMKKKVHDIGGEM
ncbi:hypothetical protein Tco_0104283 [Tanacetum coccineum]